MQITHSEEIASKNFSTEREKKKPLKCKYKNMKIGFFLSMYMSDMKYVRFNQQKKIQIFMNSENIKYTFAARINR